MSSSAQAAPRPRRAGYSSRFLGVAVPMPTLSGLPTTVLRHLHYSVLFRPDRKLAAVSSVMIDGRTLVDVKRTRDVWRLDERVPTEAQAGPDVYEGNAFDRGHLTRRSDPAWGTSASAGSDDTFYYTNAAPQAAMFNESKQLWAGLEDYLLDNAATYNRRLIVHTGPVLADDDPAYRGLQIPRRFFKVVGFLDGAQLASTAYLLDQTPELPRPAAERGATEPVAADAPPALGAYKTYQLPVQDVVRMTGLDFGPLPAVDRFAGPAHLGETGPANLEETGTWEQLRDAGDVIAGLARRR